MTPSLMTFEILKHVTSLPATLLIVDRKWSRAQQRERFRFIVVSCSTAGLAVTYLCTGECAAIPRASW
jgi:hypothetical protein